VNPLNTLLAANSATSTNHDVSGIFASQGFNLVGTTNGSTGWTANDLVGNNAAPLDPLLSPLRDNGGPTWTIALLPGSPAIDAGVSAGLTTDQRGRFRPIDDPTITNAPGGDGCDIGALELQLQPITLLGPVKQGSDLMISFLSEIGQRYRIEQKNVLMPGPWTTVSNNIAGTGANIHVLDAGAASQPVRFYRGQTLP
jgi:hypothetical protein